MASHKILYDLKQLSYDLPSHYSAGLVAEDKYHWEAHITGLPESPYVGGVFFLSIHFLPDYPLKPPKVGFKNKVFHPNISSTGAICLDILKEKWSPVFTIAEVLLSIRSLLKYLNLDDPHPHVPEIAHMYKTYFSQYESTARSWTEK